MNSSSWKRHTQLRAISPRKQAEREARRDAVMLVKARDQHCQWDTHGGHPSVACGGPLDVHEPLTRARGGDPTDPDACVLLCRRHHDWVHAHPREASCLGLLRAAR